MCRWQKNKDILWYTREKGSDEAQQRADELAAIKAREEDLMAEVHSAFCTVIHKQKCLTVKVQACNAGMPDGHCRPPETFVVAGCVLGKGSTCKAGPPPAVAHQSTVFPH